MRAFARQAGVSLLTAGGALLGLVLASLPTSSSAKSVVFEGAQLGPETGWHFEDGAKGQEGEIQSTPAGAWIRDDEAAPGPGATLRKDIEFVPSGACYEATISVELKSIGLADDSSGSHSSGVIYFSFGGVGLDLRIYGDRLILDPQMKQYQVVRFGDGPQELTFLVDVEQQRVRIRRNGIPVGLYQASELAEAGFRVTAMGVKDTPCEMLVSRIAVADAQWDNPPHEGPTAYRSREVLPAEWPAYYRDPRNTSRSPLTGRSAQLRVVGSAPIGGDTLEDVWAYDIDGDGPQELIVADGGVIRAMDLSGKERWQAGASGSIFGFFDLDGDGVDEMVLNPLTALNLTDGQKKFSAEDPESGSPPSMGPWKIADLDPSTPGLEAVFLRGTRGYVYRFIAGEETAELYREFDITEVAQGFVPSLVVADMDSAGTKEIVFVTYDRAYVLNLADGQPRMMHYWNSGRNYADLLAANIDGDPYPELIVHSTTLREHLAVLDNDGLNLTLRYDKFYEQNYPDNDKDYAVCLDSVQDFDGDGSIEILQSLYNDQGDQRWHTLLLDAVSGEVKYDLADCRAEGVVVRGGGLPPWILLAKAQGRKEFAGVAAYTPATGQRTLTSQGSLLKDTTNHDFPPQQGRSAAQSGPLLRPLSASAVGPHACLIQEEDRVSVVTLPTAADGQIERTEIDGLTLVEGDRVWLATDLDRDEQIDLVVSRPATGRLHAFSGSDGRELVSRPIRGVRRSATAARLEPGDDQLTVLVVDWRNHLLAWRDLKTEPQLAWSLAIQPRRGVFETGSSVTAHDFDGDQTREILAGLPDNQLALVSPDGKVIRTWQLDNSVYDWAIGNFNGNASSDVAVTTSGSVTQYRTLMFDSAESSPPIWQADLGPYWGGPAAFDANRDGIDDYICRYFYMRHILDGRNGLDLQSIPWRQGYHAVSVVHPWEDQQEVALLFHGGMYTQRLEKPDGTVVWEHLAQSGARHGCVGDFDGDGRLESACQTAGAVWDLKTLKPIEGNYPPTVYLWDLATGAQLAELELETNFQEGLAAADLDGDGRDELLGGTVDGRLIVLGIEQDKLQIESSISMTVGVGRPTVVDLEFDGRPEILVGCDDGRLYVLECAE